MIAVDVIRFIFNAKPAKIAKGKGKVVLPIFGRRWAGCRRSWWLRTGLSDRATRVALLHSIPFSLSVPSRLRGLANFGRRLGLAREMTFVCNESLPPGPANSFFPSIHE